MGYKAESQPEKKKEEKDKQNFALRIEQIQEAIEPEGVMRHTTRSIYNFNGQSGEQIFRTNVELRNKRKFK